MKVDLIIDLQYGSTGKGLLAGYLARYGEAKYDTAISANMPNAGHTFVSADGKKIIHKVLPSGSVSKGVRQILIGPGAVFHPAQLNKEIDDLKFWRDPMPVIRIHPNAMVLTKEHIEEEKKRLNHIASTMQGSSEAMIEKIRRKDDVSMAKHALRGTTLDKLVCSHVEYRTRLSEADYILAEGAQGYSLGIDTEFYPFTTSRNCTPSAFLTAMGIPHYALCEVWGSMRTYPIRVGNTPGGFSGDHYPDQEETTWDKIGQQAEMTTVTGRVRRVFTFSVMQLRDALWECGPNKVFLNFCNYTDDVGIARICDLVEEWGSVVKLLGFGPRESDIMETKRGH